MTEVLIFKQVTLGPSLLRRAICEFGYFRVWYDECWWWSFNDDNHSYGSEETLDEAIAACQKYYETLISKS